MTPQASPWWMLSLRVAEGQPTPFVAWIVWHHAYLVPRGLAA